MLSSPARRVAPHTRSLLGSLEQTLISLALALPLSLSLPLARSLSLAQATASCARLGCQRPSGIESERFRTQLGDPSENDEPYSTLNKAKTVELFAQFVPDCGYCGTPIPICPPFADSPVARTVSRCGVLAREIRSPDKSPDANPKSGQSPDARRGWTEHVAGGFRPFHVCFARSRYRPLQTVTIRYSLFRPMSLQTVSCRFTTVSPETVLAVSGLLGGFMYDLLCGFAPRICDRCGFLADRSFLAAFAN